MKKRGNPSHKHLVSLHFYSHIIIYGPSKTLHISISYRPFSSLSKKKTKQRERERDRSAGAVDIFPESPGSPDPVKENEVQSFLANTRQQSSKRAGLQRPFCDCQGMYASCTFLFNLPLLTFICTVQSNSL